MEENKQKKSVDATQENEAVETPETEETSNPEAEETKKAEENQEKEATKAEASKTEEKDSHLKEQMLRLQADFENFKKRSSKEKTERYNNAVRDVMTSLLPIIDNFERAEAAADADETANFENYRDGVKMIFKSLLTALQEQGLEEIEAFDQPFDPNFHHGVAVGEDPDKPDQRVLEVFQKGYICKGTVIRPAMVKVNNN